MRTFKRTPLRSIIGLRGNGLGRRRATIHLRLGGKHVGITRRLRWNGHSMDEIKPNGSDFRARLPVQKRTYCSRRFLMELVDDYRMRLASTKLESPVNLHTRVDSLCN